MAAELDSLHTRPVETQARDACPPIGRLQSIDLLPFDYSFVSWPLRCLGYGSIAVAVGYAFHQGVERWFLHGRFPGFRSQPISLADRVA